jgi:hypothetical protein
VKNSLACQADLQVSMHKGAHSNTYQSEGSQHGSYLGDRKGGIGDRPHRLGHSLRIARECGQQRCHRSGDLQESACKMGMPRRHNARGIA